MVNYTYDCRQAKTQFEKGDKVQIAKSHGFKEWHGDKGTIDKYVPFGKYYVDMDNGERRIVSGDDLDPV